MGPEEGEVHPTAPLVLRGPTGLELGSPEGSPVTAVKASAGAKLAAPEHHVLQRFAGQRAGVATPPSIHGQDDLLPARDARVLQVLADKAPYKVRGRPPDQPCQADELRRRGAGGGKEGAHR